MKAGYVIHDKCNFCSSIGRDVVFKLESQNVVRCKNCKLVYIDKQRSDLKQLYNQSYYFVKNNNSKANYADYRNQETIIYQNFNFAYKYIKNKMNSNRNMLLEIGSGFGYFLKYLPDKIKSEAVEVSGEAVNAIKKNTKAKVYEGDFLDAKIRNKYDFIVSFDVIEHQIYLKEYLIKIHGLLKKDSVFIFTTPDFNTIYNKILGKKAPLIQPLYHNYYLDKNWLTTNLNVLGYEMISIRTVYTAKMNLGYILLMCSFIFPFIMKLNLIRVISKFKIDKLTIPFFRLGGIECIVKKVS